MIDVFRPHQGKSGEPLFFNPFLQDKRDKHLHREKERVTELQEEVKELKEEKKKELEERVQELEDKMAEREKKEKAAPDITELVRISIH